MTEQASHLVFDGSSTKVAYFSGFSIHHSSLMLSKSDIVWMRGRRLERLGHVSSNRIPNIEIDGHTISAEFINCARSIVQLL